MVLDDASPQDPMPGGGGEERTGSIVPFNPEFPIPKHAPNQVRPETILRPGIFMLPFHLGPGPWRSKLQLSIDRRLMAMHAIAERALTQEEVDCVTERASAKIYYERFGVPLGILASAWSINRRLVTDDSWRAYYHREGKWVQPVEGVKALMNMSKTDSTAAVRILGSAGMRSIFWLLTTMTVTNIGATFFETMGMATDPRLASFREESRRQTPEARRRKNMEAFKREAAEKKGVVSGKEAGQEEHYGQQEPEQEQLGSVSAAASSSWESSPPSPSPSYRPQPVAEQPQGQSFFDDDDASPTAPEYRAAESKKQGGSAWDRIRQQNLSGSSQQNQRASNSWEGASSSGSSSSSSDPDWTRQRERRQSQAEFDRLVEAERNAGSDSWGGGKSW